VPTLDTNKNQLVVATSFLKEHVAPQRLQLFVLKLFIDGRPHRVRVANVELGTMCTKVDLKLRASAEDALLQFILEPLTFELQFGLKDETEEFNAGSCSGKQASFKTRGGLDGQC
jgi:hypothetical protein